MTHEFKKIATIYKSASAAGIRAVLATVVALDGSSYRKPGVCMLILENGEMTGAVSGGCVEKEILRQASSVFKTGISKVMTYDGRYRSGCEGILYVLIEPFQPNDLFFSVFFKTLEDRTSFKISSYFKKEDSEDVGFGSTVQFQNDTLQLNLKHSVNTDFKVLDRKMKPCFKLIIIGAEHDAVLLCSFAFLMGWEVTVVVNPSEEKNSTDFKGANKFLPILPEELDTNHIDDQTAIILMNHSYAKDLLCLMALKDSLPAYLGMLGPSKRREKLLNEFLEYCPEVSDTFFDAIHGPAGLNIGAETPQEIAIAIISEILAVTRKQKSIPLRDKQAGIHN
ncbi:Xanthine and CO dehydrogenases maturation factor, XdhC/CoxF family [hydrothermal vent metagenome]|uniref:Xanthine and CO dehydrogenases maturation factor, XdhC/CoxF family n=1 Tax=hydrothermal vent metagenome TaxID=652676 RepID=A0A3B0SW35_9ZZZZ